METPVAVYVVMHFYDVEEVDNVAVFDDKQRALDYAYSRAVESGLGMQPVSDRGGLFADEDSWQGYHVRTPYDNDMKFQVDRDAFLVETHILNQPPKLEDVEYD